jgi:phosphatidylglycerol:prolipoprotein diacylglycerol transferase
MLPVLFKIGTFEVHSYGVLMVIAFIASIALAQFRAPRYKLTRNQVGDLCFWCLVAGVLGARIVFIAQEWDYYSKHTSELYSLQFRGLTSFGGLFFGMAAAIVWSIRNKISGWVVLDLAAPAFVLGHAIGRIGCLLNGCCFGGACPTGLPWGIHVENSSVLHHPAQAYDTLMNLLVLGYLLYRERKGLNLGQLAGLALALHGATRVVYEFWRAGTEAQVNAGEASSTYWGSLPFTQAQAMAGAIVIAGIAIYFVFRRGKALDPNAVAKSNAIAA